jgi:hypothetical protein
MSGRFGSIARVFAAAGALVSVPAGVAMAQNDWQFNANNTDIFFTGGNVGIGVGSPGFPLSIQTTGPARAINAANNTATGTVYALWAQVLSPAGRGAIGFSNATTGTGSGFYGQSNSTDGRGVTGLHNASTGPGNGVFGQTNSTGGRGVNGLATAATGTTYGVFGQANSSTGTGVAGQTSSVTGGANTIGVSGIANSENATGVFGRGNGSSTGLVYGVLGVTSTTNGFGVFATGDSGASGAKTFLIDHPTEPETKFLAHYSIEAPEPFLVYRGTAVLDGSGSAVVALPAYFDDINRDPQYQLTAIGAPAPMLHIASEVENNEFVIAGGMPGMKVSWTVTATRNDRWMQEHPPVAERVKPAAAQGKYLNPELYGQPASKGMFNVPNAAPTTPDVPVEAQPATGVKNASGSGRPATGTGASGTR